jgi:hypothetical protein
MDRDISIKRTQRLRAVAEECGAILHEPEKPLDRPIIKATFVKATDEQQADAFIDLLMDEAKEAQPEKKQ